MSKHIQVAIFEDNERAIEELRRLLTAAGHQIVGDIAATREEVKELVRLIATSEIKPGVILLDHNLTGIKGAEVAAQLKRHKLNIPIIGTSIVSKQHYTDHSVPKWSSEFRLIGEFINDL